MQKDEFVKLIQDVFFKYPVKLLVFDDMASITTSDESKLLDFRNYGQPGLGYNRIIFHNNYYDQIYNILIKYDKLTQFLNELEYVILKQDSKIK